MQWLGSKKGSVRAVNVDMHVILYMHICMFACIFAGMDLHLYVCMYL